MRKEKRLAKVIENISNDINRLSKGNPNPPRLLHEIQFSGPAVICVNGENVYTPHGETMLSEYKKLSSDVIDEDDYLTMYRLAYLKDVLFIDDNIKSCGFYLSYTIPSNNCKYLRLLLEKLQKLQSV